LGARVIEAGKLVEDAQKVREGDSLESPRSPIGYLDEGSGVADGDERQASPAKLDESIEREKSRAHPRHLPPPTRRSPRLARKRKADSWAGSPTKRRKDSGQEIDEEAMDLE
jgi:hypothetical protein